MTSFCLKIKFGSWPGGEPNLTVQRGGNFGQGGGDRVCVCVCICQGCGRDECVVNFPYPKAIFIFFLTYCRTINLSSCPCVQIVSCLNTIDSTYDALMEKAMAPHSSTLAWKIPWDGRAWQAAVHGVARSRTRLSDFTFTFHFHVLEKEMATHSSVLAWRIPGMGEPGGLPSMGSHRV